MRETTRSPGAPRGRKRGRFPSSIGPPAAAWGLALILLAGAVPRVWLITVEPGPGRLWDERYTLENVAALLERGAFEPRSYWYGSLSYLPQVAAVAAVEAADRTLGGALPDPRTPDGRGFTPSGYVLCRAFQAAYGLASLVLVFLLGRRLASPAVGLAGAFFLAMSPRHVHASSVLKPDVLLLLLSVAALLGIVEAVRRLRPGPYLRSGLAIGLATATKLNGGALGLPLALGTALRSGGRWRWVHLLGAGVTSLAVFAVLNPRVDRVWDAFRENRRLYAQRGAGDRLESLFEMAGYLFDPGFHGPLVASLTLAGAGVLARRAWRAGLRSAEGGASVAFLSFPVLYGAAYLGVTPHAKENHFLQVLPFTALLAALALEAARGWWARRSAPGRRPWATAATVLVVVLLVAVVVGPALSFTYRAAVPRTESLAIAWLDDRLPPPRGARTIVWDGGLERVPELGRLWTGIRFRDGIETVSEGELLLSDALVARRDGVAAAALEYLARLPEADVEVFHPGGVTARGPEVVVAVRPLALVGDPRRVRLVPRPGRPGAFGGALGIVPEGADLVSCSVTVPVAAGDLSGVTLRLRGEALPMVYSRPRAGGSMALTPRLPAPAGVPLEVEVRFSGAVRDRAGTGFDAETLRSAAARGGLTATLFGWAAPSRGSGGDG